jgi:zinc transport system substrate-binding protein
MSRTVLVLICLAAVAGSCGSSGSSTGSDGKLEVVAAFYPLAWAAERIRGDTVDVHNLTRPGAEPHDVELTPRDVARIRSADVVLYLGSGFQPAVEDAVKGASGKAVDLLAGQQLAQPAEAEGELTQDPHIWLDPVRYAAVVRRVGRLLGRPRPARMLVTQLVELNREYARGLARCRRREIVTTHAAFGYLARRYHLRQIPITGLSPEAEPTPRDLEGVVERVRASKASTVFFETLISPRLAETVARETGARTDVLDPLEGLSQDELDRGADYLSVMRENLASLRRALDCR